MTSTPNPAESLRAFLRGSAFASRGAVFTDLDGTAVLEREGRIYLPPTVEAGLEHIRQRGRPVIANTLRFPISVISVFFDEWHRSTGAALPLVSLKGSQVGRIVRSAGGQTAFEEWHATPLEAGEVEEVLTGVEGMVGDGVRDLLVFYYRRDWRQGERIWTPDPARVAATTERYRSASAVHSSDLPALRETLLAEPLCMIFLLVATPQDKLMAYQHTRRSSFFTHAGVSKRTGSREIARHLDIDLAASIGCGDAPPDDFLAETGFAVIVGGNDVEYKGLVDTVRVPGIAELGELLAVIGERLE